jgi:hypothetical protein
MDHASCARDVESPATQTRNLFPQTAARRRARPERPLIYLDTSVALAYLLAEDRVPSEALWREPLISSRLLEYEIWTRIHALRLTDSHADEVRMLLSRIALVELAPPVLVRALEPFPRPVRSLHALHLASVDFLRATKTSRDARQL